MGKGGRGKGDVRNRRGVSAAGGVHLYGKDKERFGDNDPDSFIGYGWVAFIVLTSAIPFCVGIYWMVWALQFREDGCSDS